MYFNLNSPKKAKPCCRIRWKKVESPKEVIVQESDGSDTSKKEKDFFREYNQ
jgi:hypothetical protein